jgi:hypothetical protein
MPDLSILIPHKHETENDKALSIALSCLALNTRSDYEILVDSTTPADPYVVLNDLARAAHGDYLFLSNSDIFVSPNWDVDLLSKAEPETMVTVTLVEPGAIGIFPGNMQRNFGMTPDSFRRGDFEEWAGNPDGALPDGLGFYYYALIHRETFLMRGGFDVTRGTFPTPLDIHFWNAWLADGLSIMRASSLVYHLQNYSNREEQIKAVRHG